jgi:hypothetical protein
MASGTVKNMIKKLCFANNFTNVFYFNDDKNILNNILRRCYVFIDILLHFFDFNHSFPIVLAKTWAIEQIRFFTNGICKN